MEPNKQIIQRIKLLMEYDLSKTLEENVNNQSNWSLYPCVTQKPNYKKIETETGIHYLSKGDWLWNYSPDGTFTAKDNLGKIVKSGIFYCDGDKIVTTIGSKNITTTGNLTTPIDATMTSTGGVQNYSATSPGTMGFSSAQNFKIPNEILHDALPWMSLASYFIPYVGPFASIGFDLYDAELYASEGDYFTAGLYLALSFIPGDDILKIVSRRYRVSRSAIKSLLKKLINKVTKFTEEEIKIMKGIAEEDNEIIKVLKKYLQKRLAKQLFKPFTLKRFVTYMWLWSKNHPAWNTIIRLGLKFGGIKYTYLQLAEIYGLKKIDDKSKPKVDIKKLETDFQSNKDEIISEAVDDLLPYTEHEQLFNSEIYLDSAYAK